MTIEIYPAQKSDAKLILDMIIELAVYECCAARKMKKRAT